jgi:hypothetical protein
MYKIQFFVKIIKTFTMIKKRRWSSKYATIINRAIVEVPDFANLFHRFKRTMSVLGRSESVELRSAQVPYGNFILKTPHWLDVEMRKNTYFTSKTL